MEQKLNFPEKELLDKAINTLKSIDLKKVSYEKILYYLIKEIVVLPITVAKIIKGYPVFRARVNKDDEIFYSENEISYRVDNDNIKDYGRANIPKQSMFYGAIESKEVPHPRLVNLFETSELFREPNDKDGEFILTVGKWRVKEDFKVIEMVFSKGNVQNNEDINRSYNKQKEMMLKDYPDQLDQIEKILEFFSDEFAKKVKNSNSDYKITTAYLNLALMNKQDLCGVTYPSVRTDYKANNIAIFPSVVEQFLDLEMVSMFNIKKSGKNASMDNLAIAFNLGDLNTNFEWIDIQGKNQTEINEIYKSFKK